MRKCVPLTFLNICLLVASYGADTEILVHKTVSEVQLAVVATDRSGHPVSNLSSGELSVVEDGRPVPSFDLRSASDLPLRVGIVLDLSGSMRKAWPTVRTALSRSLPQFVRPQDQLLILAFDHKIEVEETISRPQQVALVDMPQPGGLTALYDTLCVASREAWFANTGEPRRSALILFSDGEDNLSRHDLEEAIASVQAAGIAVYSISQHSHKRPLEGDAVLRELSAASGGRSFVAADGVELQRALRAIEGELRSSYLLYYRTPEGAARFRRVRLVPTHADGLELRSRAGYYTSK